MMCTRKYKTKLLHILTQYFNNIKIAKLDPV